MCCSYHASDTINLDHRANPERGERVDFWRAFGFAQYHATAMLNQDLRSLADRLANLIENIERVRDPLDYLVGATHALFRAEELKYDGRSFALPEDYWQAPVKRARQMAQTGVVRHEGKWLAGFYFNSALVRIAASFHRVLVLLTKQDDRVRDLVKQVQKTNKFSHANLMRVHKEVNLIKHNAAALKDGRKVTFAVAIGAMKELIDFVEARQADF